jgi:delta 1-pyrroline-5-carboxylate dehydrogenase
MLAALKVTMALCTGNTLVLKAAEDAPLGVLKMAEVCRRHLPKDVLQVVTGYGEETGGALLNHPGIAKITFTGSTEVGKIAMRAAAERILPVSLELGGKSPAIVYPSCDDDATVQHVIAAMRVQYLARSSADVAAHAGKAALAAATALSTSSAVPSGIFPITSSVVELMTSMDLVPVEGTHAPSM